MDMSSLRFSVVIPTYNRAAFIGKTIEGVLSQTYQDFEIIVVDDGSTDDTESVVQRYVGKKLAYYKKKNEERATARNFGTQLAKGDYINWFDSDDLMLAAHLAEAQSLISERSDPEAIALSYARMHLDSGRITNTILMPRPTVNEFMFRGNILGLNPVFVRRDIALKFPFNQNRALSGSEDYDLWMRLAARFQIYSANAVTSILVHHGGRSMSELDMEKIEERIAIAWESLWADNKIVEKYGHHRAYMQGFKEAFLAVHYAESKNSNKARQKLYSAFRAYPMIAFSKTFMATVKKLTIG